MVAVWDDTVQEVSKPDLDEVWLDANIGGWLHKTFGQDQVYILNPTTNRSTQPLMANASIPQGYAAIAPALQRIIWAYGVILLGTSASCRKTQSQPLLDLRQSNP